MGKRVVGVKVHKFFVSAVRAEVTDGLMRQTNSKKKIVRKIKIEYNHE